MNKPPKDFFESEITEIDKSDPELFMITCLFTKSTALAVEATLDASPYQQIF